MGKPYQRRTVQRPRTVPLKRLRVLLDPTDVHYDRRALAELDNRPLTRGDCAWCMWCQADRDGVLLTARPCNHVNVIPHSRPCARVACRHHTALEVNVRGGIKMLFPDRDVMQIPDSCSLDVAETGPLILEAVAQRINVVRERARQIESMALRHMAVLVARSGLDD